MQSRRFRCVLLLLLSLGIQSCLGFDQDDYIKALETLTYPNASWSPDDLGQWPSALDQQLLIEHRPELYVDADSCGPMDFYKQYTSQLRGSAEGFSGPVDREVLKRFERDQSFRLELPEPPDCIQSSKPPLYAYSWSETLDMGQRKIPIKILKYNLTFYKSGLPAEQRFWQKLSALLGDSDNWHYLDIHGGMFYILGPKNQLMALVLAQHNHFRTYVVGVDIDKEQAKTICFARRSNEPYLCKESQALHPVAPTMLHMRWVVSGDDRPWLGAWDLVPGIQSAQRVTYDLAFLRHKDPLITSWQNLGPNLKILGVIPSFFRDAPPGMAVYNSPSLKDVINTAQYFYFDGSNDAIFETHESQAKDFFQMDVTEVLNHNGRRFRQALRKAGHID